MTSDIKRLQEALIYTAAGLSIIGAKPEVAEEVAGSILTNLGSIMNHDEDFAQKVVNQIRDMLRMGAVPNA